MKALLFAGFTPEEIATKVLRPDRPGLQQALAAATTRGNALLREAAARGEDVRAAADRRRILQQDAEVEALWEALAPPPWVGDARRRFRGPTTLHVDRRRAAEGAEDRIRDYPFYPEDVVGLVADVAAVQKCEDLLHEAAARAEALGWHPVPRVTWYALARRDAMPKRPELQNMTFTSFVRAKVRSYLALPGVDEEALVDTVMTRVRPPWSLPRRFTSKEADRALRPVWRILVGCETWRRASEAGYTVDHGPTMAELAAAHRRAAGLPLARFTNPFEPLVHALMTGYVPADLTREGAYVLFPRLQVNEMRPARRVP